MKRRIFVAGSAGIPALASVQTEAPSPIIIELRYFYCRNTTDNQRARLTGWLVKTALPALERAGAGPIGLFSSSIAPDGPFILGAAGHKSLDAFDKTHEKLMKDQEFKDASEAFFAGPGLPFQRMETQLLRAFRGFPGIEVPAPRPGAPGRLFELRTYESNSPASLAKKIGMFESGEIEIFRKTGLTPVFFGEMIAGPKMPNLTYMVCHDSLSAREANWRNFGGSPEWKKLAATPGLSDGEIVSNISTALLSPLAGSPIR